MKVQEIAGAPAWAPIKSWFWPDKLPWLKLPRLESVWGTAWIKLGNYKDQQLGLNQVTMSLEGSLLFIAAGAIMGFRQAWSLMLGAFINYVILAPHFLRLGVIEAPSFRKISAWSLWIGVPMMVTSGLLLFFMNWKAGRARVQHAHELPRRQGATRKTPWSASRCRARGSSPAT
jgi:hypothetical protein